MYNQMCLLVFSCVYNELQLCCCLVAALFNVRGSSRRLSRLCQLQRFVVEVWRKKCHMLSPTSSSSTSHSSSPRSNLDKRFSEFLHLIELTAQWEASPSRHPRLTATAEGEVGTSLSALLPKRHICFFFRWVHGGVASAAQAATEKTVTDRGTSLLPQQLTEPRSPVWGTFQNKSRINAGF